MVRRASDVSDAELDVLQTLWKEGAGTVREVIDRLGPQKKRWAYTTVQTLLGRLEAKGIVKSDKTGLAHVFEAAVTRQAFLSGRLADLADKVCEGTKTPLVQALVDEGKFTADQLAEFRRLLDDAAARSRGGKSKRSNH